MKTVIQHLRRAALLQEGSDPTDEQLLELFLARRDEVAFEALMRRHGPMVLGVCRRVLRNAHDAEDAFQATFLVFVRKAGSLRSRELLANWLYGVAHRTAMKARAMHAKRRTKESRAAARPHPEASTGSADEALLEQLDLELSRLPEKYRVPVVLCELEGRSRKEVAHLLGVPEGTLSWRLAQAKKMLAKRLSRHELAIPLGVLAVGLSPTLRASTLKAVLTAGAVPAKVLALTEGVMKAMFLTKLKITACAATLMLLAGVGVSGLTYRATAQSPQTKETLASRSQTDELEALRLEMEALRKSLQATRERVKTLEGEVSALKGQRQSSQGAGTGGRPGTQPSDPTSGRPQAMMPPVSDRPQALMPLVSDRPQALMPPVSDRPQALMPPVSDPQPGISQGMKPPGRMGPMMRKRTFDPVADAEKALKKLKENPGDKQATEALERALKRLKEQEKPKVTGEGTPNSQ
jgi:RNA polymerase sigma factor (sigma-70 family)